MTKPPVQIDVGARAEARFEVKTEVPSKSAGRLVDALTDAIRPFTEARGLRADQIRLQREEVLLEIAKRASARLAVECAFPHPIPNKFLVPLLERASLEDEESGLSDWWAALLVSAAKSTGAQKPIYVDLLSKIGSDDAQFLEKLWTVRVHSAGTWLLSTTAHSDLEEELAQAILKQGKLNEDDEWPKRTRKTLMALQKAWADRGCIASYFSYPTGRGRERLMFPPIAEPIDTSIGLGLLSRAHIRLAIPAPWIGEFDVAGEFLMLTPLGDAFLAACHAEVAIETSDPASAKSF